MVGCILSVSSALYMCGFAVGTDLWKKKAAEKEREAGVLLLFEEERGVGLAGVTGWGREPNVHGRAPLLPCERRPIVPGTFQSGFPEVPCHSPSPIISYFFPLIHSSFWMAFCSSQPKQFTFSSNYLTNCFSCHSDSHSRLFVSSVSLWPPSRSGLNSMHYVISVGCVHTAMRCRITMP